VQNTFGFDRDLASLFSTQKCAFGICRAASFNQPPIDQQSCHFTSRSHPALHFRYTQSSMQKADSPTSASASSGDAETLQPLEAGADDGVEWTGQLGASHRGDYTAAIM
jgi:hypothetical protein